MVDVEGGIEPMVAVVSVTMTAVAEVGKPVPWRGYGAVNFGGVGGCCSVGGGGGRRGDTNEFERTSSTVSR